MGMLSREFCGILLLAATGICVTGDMVTSKVIEGSKWPYWYLLVGACLLASIGNGIAIYCCGMELPGRKDLKWVLARSLLEDLHWYLAVIAVLIGASPGDVAALTSIDIIAAALFGLIFLGEKLGIWHYVALLLSMAGAICISQPDFIFGSGGHQSPLGCCMALLSGCFQAGSFVCARKSAHLSVGVLTFTTLLLAVPMGLIPPWLMPHESHLEPLMAEPGTALALVLMIALWTMADVALPAAGATRCPAAVSATVFTSSSMVSGYIAQVVFFKQIPQALTLLGAACMLASVVIMALPRKAQEEELPPKVVEEDGEVVVESVESATEASEDDEIVSLGSFVASEVSFRSIRRRLQPKPSSLAERIGKALPMAILA